MREKTYLKKVILGIMVLGILLFVPKMQASAADCISLEGDNERDQNIIYHGKPIHSYLSYDGTQTLMRVQAAYGFEGVLVEYFDMNYQLLRNQIIPQELPKFGGFYETATNYYLVTGQNNLSEDPSVEVVRITKYDKSWNRITSVGLYDCNTKYPFWSDYEPFGSSMRFAECGRWLLIRTAHVMYSDIKTSFTIQLDTETMKITESQTSIYHVLDGGVWESTNPFIGIDNNRMISVDQVLDSPNVVLIKNPTDVTTGRFSRIDGVDGDFTVPVNVLGDKKGDDYPFATVGGFEVASDNYLIAGNSKDIQNLTRSTRNIFISTVSKTDYTATTKWLTNSADGEYPSTPHLVKVSDNSYLLLWAMVDSLYWGTKKDIVYYVQINGAGEQVGDIYSMEGNLSDCKPILVNGNIIWYTWSNETITFYRISASNLADFSATQVFTGHKYECISSNNNYADLKCAKCGNIQKIALADYIEVWWGKDADCYGPSGTMSQSVDLNKNVNETWYYKCNLFKDDFVLDSAWPARLADDYEIESSNPNVIEINKIRYTRGMLTAKNTGTATISFWPKFNPDKKESFTFNVCENTDKNESSPQNGWKTESDGTKYWYENGVRQGTEGRGKEIYDPASDAWYWLDAPDGKMAYSKDVYQESLAGDWGDYIGADGQRYGKWVRYDANGHMIKGWQTNENGTYFFDYIYGTMAKGYATIDGIEYYFNPATGILERQIATVPEMGWMNIDGIDYWYENHVRQGYSVDRSYRGKEIYDSGSDAWYWLDNIDNGKKATGKDVYQESLAGDWGDIVGTDGQRYGKWVRYDENGHMIKGWQTNENGTYFFDYTYGTMAKGHVTIEGQSYYFDEVTGVLR